MENNVSVKIWNSPVGIIYWDRFRKRSVFEYDKDFITRGLDISPLAASIGERRYQIPFYGLDNDGIYYGLPAFLSDSLPGRWGNTVFSAWAQSNGIDERKLTAVDKLSFIGARAMGALEFEPAKIGVKTRDFAIEELYRKAKEIYEMRENVMIHTEDLSLEGLYEVGTSAGGMHTKALIARNDKTKEIRSGQVLLSPDYTYYLLKFAEKDFEFLQLVEYIYYLMAKKAGIQMMPSELIEIGGERHFMTERFDRKNGHKIHVQSLAAIRPGASSHEDLMLVCEDLQLGLNEKTELFRRIVFNILTANVDAHIKNFSFMMEEDGKWRISPAYDLTFSCLNPGGRIDSYHSMSLGGKTSGIGRTDLIDFGRRFSIKNPDEIIEQIIAGVRDFRDMAEEVGLSEKHTDFIERHIAEMNPEMLSGLKGYRPHTYSFYIQEKKVEEAYWEIMNNGAVRLHAKIDGNPRQITFSKTSEVTKRMHEDGGIRMPEESLRAYLTQYLIKK